MIIGIVAIAKNYAIGKEGKLPWHYSADLKFFKKTTLNSAIVMGFNTWKSIGKPLPKRLSIVMSRSRDLNPQPNAILMRKKEEVVALAAFLEGDVFVIGGSETYKTFADVIEKWIVTEIPETVQDADVFMQQDFLNGFRISNSLKLDDDLYVKTYTKI